MYRTVQIRSDLGVDMISKQKCVQKSLVAWQVKLRDFAAEVEQFGP